MKFEERLEFVLDQKRQVHNQSGDESKTYPCDIEDKLNHTHTLTPESQIYKIYLSID